MRIIVTGTDGWAIDLVATDLERRGHTVLLCHEPGQPSFPCTGLRDGDACPLKLDADVMVTARGRPLPQPARREIAVTCTVHHRIPLVVAGQTILHPFKTVAAAVVEGFDGVESACAAVLPKGEACDHDRRSTERPPPEVPRSDPSRTADGKIAPDHRSPSRRGRKP